MIRTVGVVLQTTGKVIDFECPINGTRFGAGGKIRVPVPLGMSAYQQFANERPLHDTGHKAL